jgi:serine/threonine-protein kinase
LIAGRYRVERKLGTGGMGVVVAAVDEHTGHRVAVKLLLPEGPTPPPAYRPVDDSGIVERSNRHIEMSTRLIREASAASRLSSEHVTRVLDVGRLDSGDPFVVMELLEGVDLNRYAKERGPLGIVETVNLVLQACEAIFEAHALGIVHRDLKPANLFLTQKADGTPFVKVLDFGISKVLGADDNQLTQTSDMLGSPLYMAPEQIRNARDVDARADVWSLGTILYRLLAGRPAFEGQGSAATLAAIIGDAPYPLRALRPDVPPDLEAIVLRCLEKDRTRRIQTVRELGIALQRFTVAQTGSMLPAIALPPSVPPAMPPSVPPALPPATPLPPSMPMPGPPSMASFDPSTITLSEPKRRGTAFYAAIGVVTGLVLAGGAAAWKLSSEPDRPRSGTAPSASATGALAASSASSPGSADVPAPSSSASTTTASAAASATASAAPSASATARPSSPPKSTSRPVYQGKPSDDPLGDRL